jgi:hypothetical protein
MMKNVFVLPRFSDSAVRNRTAPRSWSRNSLSCVWIATGNPAQPLACVWIDSASGADSETLISESSAAPPSRTLSIVARRRRIEPRSVCCA